MSDVGLKQTGSKSTVTYSFQTLMLLRDQKSHEMQTNLKWFCKVQILFYFSCQTGSPSCCTVTYFHVEQRNLTIDISARSGLAYFLAEWIQPLSMTKGGVSPWGLHSPPQDALTEAELIKFVKGLHQTGDQGIPLTFVPHYSSDSRPDTHREESHTWADEQVMSKYPGLRRRFNIESLVWDNIQ